MHTRRSSSELSAFHQAHGLLRLCHHRSCANVLQRSRCQRSALAKAGSARSGRTRPSHPSSARPRTPQLMSTSHALVVVTVPRGAVAGDILGVMTQLNPSKSLLGAMSFTAVPRAVAAGDAFEARVSCRVTAPAVVDIRYQRKSTSDGPRLASPPPRTVRAAATGLWSRHVRARSWRNASNA